jgi:hypothetical protein
MSITEFYDNAFTTEHFRNLFYLSQIKTFHFTETETNNESNIRGRYLCLQAVAINETCEYTE